VEVAIDDPFKIRAIFPAPSLVIVASYTGGFDENVARSVPESTCDRDVPL
jgi:hypothetical protein